MECLKALEGADKQLSASQADFHKGNGKARIRMSAQYYVAAAYGMAVILLTTTVKQLLVSLLNLVMVLLI